MGLAPAPAPMPDPPQPQGNGVSWNNPVPLLTVSQYVIFVHMKFMWLLVYMLDTVSKRHDW